ncbi:MAG: protein adenylyltransferase SelO family protein, partial [Bdellovibrionales bacterium]|nr:protein adenylyltransferase SelO family protein [Bdellovibrionales bacterium]
MNSLLKQQYKEHLTEDFYSEVSSREFKSPKLLAYNKNLADFLNLPNFNNTEACLIFSGQKNISNSTPIAMVYAGHQFGHFVPRLGDGRAKLLGNIKAKDEKNYDIQLKGSGPTKYSRSGDGLSALGPVIREYIVSEAMHNLGIPTTRALAAVSTGEEVVRESMEPGGVFTRVARSHIRIGNFEYFFSQGKTDELKLLANFCMAELYPECKTY